MEKYWKYLLLGIVIVASMLRFWQLGVVPPSPNWDEVALGYNAYSLIQTGKDEYGASWPIILRSYDDYKPALYTYFIIPWIALFDLSVLAVRLPSAVFGVLAVLATYFLVYELFKKRNIALLSAFLLAISPWHIQFSRIAFESNVGLAFNIFAALLFLKGLSRPWLLPISAILMGLNLSIYQSDKVFTPLLAFLLIGLFWKQLFVVPKKYLIISVLVGLVTALPMVYLTLTDKASLSRAQGVSVISIQAQTVQLHAKRLLRDSEKGYAIGKIFDNRRVAYAKEITSGYLSHFDVNWLFTRGDIARHHAPAMGLLYLWEFPFLLLGIYMLIFGNYPKKTKLFIFGWMLIAPIPASITTGVPHAVRTLNFLPTLQIITALGVLSFLVSISKIKYLPAGRQGKMLKMNINIFIYCLFLLFFMFNFLYYLNQYFVQLNYFTSLDWQYGWKDTVAEVQKLDSLYDKVVITNKAPLDQSYMFFLFYLKYPPEQYQINAKNASGGFRENHQFGKYEFRPINWPEEVKDGKTLYVGKPDDFPVGVKMVKQFYYLNNEPAIYIVEGR